MRTILSTTRPTRTRVTATVTVAVLALGLSACGSDDGEAVEGSAAGSSNSASASPSESTDPATGTPTEGGETASTEPAEPAGPSIDVTVEGDQVSPNAESLEIEVGQPLTLNIVSDRAGEFHVHAKPEQYIDFEAGNTTTELVVETPGSVEIEEHDSGAVIALLEVR